MSDDSCSDYEPDGFFTILADLQKDAKIHEERYIQLTSRGFENDEDSDFSFVSKRHMILNTIYELFCRNPY